MLQLASAAILHEASASLFHDASLLRVSLGGLVLACGGVDVPDRFRRLCPRRLGFDCASARFPGVWAGSQGRSARKRRLQYVLYCMYCAVAQHCTLPSLVLYCTVLYCKVCVFLHSSVLFCDWPVRTVLYSTCAFASGLWACISFFLVALRRFVSDRAQSNVTRPGASHGKACP